MKVIFKSSTFDKQNIYWNKVESDESVISMQKRIYKINSKLLKSGAKHTYVDCGFISERYRRLYD